MHHSPSIEASRSIITVIGSERIHRPLRTLGTRSSSFIRTGGFPIGEQSSRLALTRLKRLSEREERFEVASGDILFLEISCSTVLYNGSEAVGTDWLEINFPSLMAQRALAKQIWRIAALPDVAARLTALDAYSTIGKTLTSEGKEKLADVSLRKISVEEMTNDLAAIHAMFPNLVVCTPCPALKSSGRPLHFRTQLIQELTQILKGLEIQQFDPAPLIERFGQDLAFEASFDGLSTYSEGFNRMIAAHLGTLYLSGSHIAAVTKVAPLSGRKTQASA